MPVSPTLVTRSAIPSESEFVAEYGDYLSKIITMESYRFNGLLPMLGMGLEDLIQEGFVRALQARKTFNPDSGVRLKTWVVTQVLFYVGDQYRRCRTLQAFQTQFEQCPPDMTHWKHTEHRMREWELLEDFRKYLSPFGYSILELRLCGMSYQEVADSLKCSLFRIRKNVPVLKELARHLLKENVEKTESAKVC